jgi:hypothetical protein
MAGAGSGTGPGVCCPEPVGAPWGRGRGDESRAGNRRKKPKIEMRISPEANPSRIKRMEKISRFRFIYVSRGGRASSY